MSSFFETRVVTGARTMKKTVLEGDIDVLDGRYKPSARKLKKIANEQGLEYVGQGSHVFVFTHPSNHEVLLAIDFEREGISEAKSTYYLHRILSTLFPHNFPRIFASAGSLPHSSNKRDGTLTGTARQRIRGKQHFPPWWKRINDSQQFDRDSYFPFSRAWETIKKLDFPITDPDFGGPNFITGPDKGTYYIDLFALDRFRPDDWNIKDIRAYMSENSLSPTEIKTVLNSIKRLIELNQTRS